MGRKLKGIIINVALATSLFLLVFFLVFFLYSVYRPIYERLSDAFFITGAIEVSFLILYLIVQVGTFDLLGYGLYSFIKGFDPVRFHPKYEDYVDYSNQKKEKRKESKFVWLPYLVEGLLSLLLALIFLFVA